MYLQKTTHLTNETLTPKWLHLDAKDKTLGRLATEIAMMLRGKTKPSFSNHLDSGDFVVVTNCRHVKMTGNKWEDKFYHHHSNHIGGIKSARARDQHQKDPCSLLYIAVKGMLPKTSQGRAQLTKLKLFADATHNHAAQRPVTLN